MEAAPWIALLVVGLVPMLVTSQTGRDWFFLAKYREYAWGFLATLAIMGAAAVFRGFGRIGTGVLAATPLLQALVFVAADRLFQLLAGRVPVAFDEARRGRRPDGGRYWVDKSFWAAIFIALLFGAVFLCRSFDIEFPSRHAR
jgi:hypothetical protein